MSIIYDYLVRSCFLSLSERQVYDFINGYEQHFGYGPETRDVAKGCGMSTIKAGRIIGRLRRLGVCETKTETENTQSA